MLNSITIDGLKAFPFTITAITHRVPQLTRSGTRFSGVIAGNCVLRFTRDAELAFHWRAEGTGSQSLDTYSITRQLDLEPTYTGPILLGDEGSPMAWSDERKSLVDLLADLEWQPLVRDVLMAAYPNESNP
ncbi:hypothetical protein ACEN2T_18230 [Pseudomonas sp. W22_MBD1_FP4]|uniref:hypothetical protein n=1 Tax=Pseudomonas sp. W22_MBD1_FP4 TaxID=3240272 RepID=UPI003F9E8C7C